MMEKLKSLLLCVLVGASLVQTYMLAYSKPYYEIAEETEYIQPELMGTRAEVADLVYPTDIVLHLGDEQHVVLYPSNVFYEEIFEKVSVRSFGGFRQIESRAIDWTTLREQRKGVELRFDEPLPAIIMDSIMHIEGMFPSGDQMLAFDKIWITTSETGEEVRTFFFQSGTSAVYEVSRADMTSKDVEQFVGFGEQYEPKFAAMDTGNDGNVLYLPQAGLETVSLLMQIEAYTPEQLQNNLFVNPGITRKLMERDGTEIYTDGKRGLQIDYDRQWMVYSDPIAPVESNTQLSNHLSAAVQFVNQHGGWNGAFRIERYSSLANQEYVFRQYYGPYPIIDLDTQSFGAIRVVMNNGIILLYERSMASLQPQATERTEAYLYGGEVLLHAIQNHPYMYVMKRIYPAYKPTMLDTHVMLKPTWVVEFLDGTREYLF